MCFITNFSTLIFHYLKTDQQKYCRMYHDCALDIKNFEQNKAHGVKKI